MLEMSQTSTASGEKVWGKLEKTLVVVIIRLHAHCLTAFTLHSSECRTCMLPLCYDSLTNTNATMS